MIVTLYLMQSQHLNNFKHTLINVKHCMSIVQLPLVLDLLEKVLPFVAYIIKGADTN